jgi:hypothetical protein
LYPQRNELGECFAPFRSELLIIVYEDKIWKQVLSETSYLHMKKEECFRLWVFENGPEDNFGTEERRNNMKTKKTL